MAAEQSRPAKPRQTQRTNNVTEDPQPEDSTYNLFTVAETHKKKSGPIMVVVTVNNSPLQMELDTGAATSIISADTYRQTLSGAPALQPTAKSLHTYTGEQLKVLGVLHFTVTYQSQVADLELTVVDGSGPSLFGRDWLQVITLDWHNINRVTVGDQTTLTAILQKHEPVFKDELGLVRGASAKIQLKPNAVPKFCKARPIPYALRDRVKKELDRMQQAGIIEPVQTAEWAAPIVPVVKSDGSIRICSDYKITVNKAAEVESYPLPKIDDQLASLGGGKTFTKLDLAHAYQQVPLADSAKQYVVINTLQGLYQYNRLPFGITSAPAIFQRIMEGILQGMPNVCVYLDDILVTGESEQVHLKTLDEVLRRLGEAGIRLKQAKCAFMKSSVEYLGHKISADGIRPTTEKLRAINDAPPPNNVSQLRSFLGLVNYYGKFLPQLATTLAPLYNLLQQKVCWKWGPPQQAAFKEAKAQLTSDCLLVHFEPKKELILACDASPYGVGAVLSHIMEDGSEKPVAFASRSLTPAERKYAQLDKEALAIIFGVSKFHQFLYGRHFTIMSDHKPLKHLLNENSTIPQMASSRIQRWALTLSAYQYSILYKPGDTHSNADGLSRLPLPESPSNPPPPGDTILMMETLETTPVRAQNIKQWTDKDPILSQVRKLVMTGWQETTNPEIQPYWKRREELSICDGCILWGHRVIVPPPGRKLILAELHVAHPGVSRMKMLARSVVWWPGMELDLEEQVKNCNDCQMNQKTPKQAPLHPWEWPACPWTRLHIDHAGPFLGKLFLVVVDSHSKWLEVVSVPSTSSSYTIEALRRMFATHGLPQIIVSDNGTAFTSQEFKTFIKNNGIQHVTTAPYHPASNGMAERAVQTFKSGLKKATKTNVLVELDRFLFQYRITPHTTTGVAPAQLLMGRTLRSRLDLLLPSMQTRVITKQLQQKANHDQHAESRSFNPGDAVYARNYSGAKKWIPGIITKITGPVSYQVTLADGKILKRHLDQIRICYDNAPNTKATDQWTSDTTDIPTLPSSTPQPAVRRSTRQRSAPDRYSPSNH